MCSSGRERTMSKMWGLHPRDVNPVVVSPLTHLQDLVADPKVTLACSMLSYAFSGLLWVTLLPRRA